FLLPDLKSEVNEFLFVGTFSPGLAILLSQFLALCGELTIDRPEALGFFCGQAQSFCDIGSACRINACCNFRTGCGFKFFRLLSTSYDSAQGNKGYHQ